MARTIAEIKASITDNVKDSNLPTLSESKASEWGLWAYIMAAAIHAFELILDCFKQEINALTARITPGTVRWYAEMCKRFQNGDSLVFDDNTALLYYPVEDTAKQIIAVAAVSEKQDADGGLAIKVAKKDAKGRIVVLDADELYNFQAYIDAVKFAGCKTTVSSLNADLICYDLTVYHDPAIPSETVRTDTVDALERFKTSIDFDGVLYRQKLIDAVMDVEGVTTCVLHALEQQSNEDKAQNLWHPVDTHTDLKAGYFDWAAEETDPSEDQDAGQGKEDGKDETGTGPEPDGTETGTPAKKTCRITIKTINELLNPNPSQNKKE